MNDNLYGVQDIRGSTSVDLSKGIVVCPLLSFYFFISFFIFILFFDGLNGSFYFSHLYTLGSFNLSSLGSFNLSTLGPFPHFRGNTLYITKSIEDISHFTKYSNHKEDVTIMMYANVCLCQGSRICNDTSASCSND